MTRSWDKLKKEVSVCQQCGLYKTRTKVVFGEGGFEKKVVLIGEAPGKNEDLQGRPFVGSAGRVLDKMLGLAGLSRNDVFITNVVKCRPPHNRDPLPEEIESCFPFLRRQLFLIKPKLVITLGRFALSRFSSGLISQVHGVPKRVKWRFKNKEISFILFPVFHPAVALYRGEYHKMLVQDFKKIKRIINLTKE
ncbi:uracil-DNA glycosylase [bacterium]|nr:uracil-DNA glycosylase [bacterium]